MSFTAKGEERERASSISSYIFSAAASIPGKVYFQEGPTDRSLFTSLSLRKTRGREKLFLKLERSISADLKIGWIKVRHGTFSAGTRSAAKKSWQNYNRMDQTSEMGIAPPYVRLCQDLSLPLSLVILNFHRS